MKSMLTSIMNNKKDMRRSTIELNYITKLLHQYKQIFYQCSNFKL